jgi:hypothetical protein
VGTGEEGGEGLGVCCNLIELYSILLHYYIHYMYTTESTHLSKVPFELCVTVV